MKSNYELAISLNPEARKLRANRTKYPPPSRVTLKELVQITNKYGIGVTPGITKKGGNNAKMVVSNRIAINNMFVNRMKKAGPQRAANLRARMNAKPKKQLGNFVAYPPKKPSCPLKKNNIVCLPLKNGRKVCLGKGKAKGIFAKRKKMIKNKQIANEIGRMINMKPSNIKPIPKTPTVTKRKAKRVSKTKSPQNINNPNIILPGETWGNFMNRYNRLTKK